MTSSDYFQHSIDVKEVIHIKACRYFGHFDADSKKFAVDPNVTSFSDVKEILANAFNLDGSFHISYLCRDDEGEDVFLAMHADWDLDAAFLTASDPYLLLKVELHNSYEGCHGMSEKEMKRSNCAPPNENTIWGSSTGFLVPPSWSNFTGNTISKITSRIGEGVLPNKEEGMQTFFPKNPPLGDCELHDYLDKCGRLVKPEDLRLRVYYGGVEPSLRKVAWRLLLNVFPERLTAQERISYMKRKTREYHQLYTQWKSLHGNSYVQELKRMIWKDVIRTDREHPFYSGKDDNPHLISLHNLLLTYALTHEKVRYCQGMSDIAATLLVVMNNEPHAYVCFCGLMTRLESNFYPDGEVMSKKFQHLALLLRHYDSEYFSFLKSLGADNMYFCYRWVLLEMKREFSFNDSLVVLEVMWSSLPPLPPENDLHLGVLNVRDVQKKRDNFKESKQNSLQSLTLSVKNLPVALKAGTSSDNQTGLIGKNLNFTNVSLDGRQFHGNKQYPLVPGRITTFQKNGESLSHATEKVHDSCVRLATSTVKHRENQLRNETISLPPPEKLGCGNPFLLFVCLSVLLEQRTGLIFSKCEYADLVMHFDKMIRRHPLAKILSQAMQLFATYLESQSSTKS